MESQANHDHSLADLARQLSDQTTELVHHEVELVAALLRLRTALEETAEIRGGDWQV